MIVVFSRPIYFDPEHPRLYLPTTQFLEALRPRFGALVNGFSNDPNSVVATSVRIEKALNESVPIDFPDGTTLEDFLKRVQEATRSPNGEVIPIYVEPIGLAEAEKSMKSTLEGVHLEHVALRTRLRLCLRQLDLAFHVRDGLLVITSQESDDELEVFPTDDYFQIVGHCLLSLVAAGLGGLVRHLFATWRWISLTPASQ